MRATRPLSFAKKLKHISDSRAMADRLIHPTPTTIAAIGRNYMAHINELNNPRPAEPFFFLKPQGSILHANPKQRVGPQQPVLIPRDANVHYEVELGVVFGRAVDAITAEEVRHEEEMWYKKGKPETISKTGLRGAWGRIIAGYYVGIDMTSRKYQDRSKQNGLPWALGKSMKTFLPLSAFIPRSKLPPFPDKSGNVQLYLNVNGEERQKDSTNLMLFDIAQLIEHVTGVFPMRMFDLLLTGTPKGVGEVKGGDVMTAGIRVNGVDVDEGRIEVPVRWREDGYGSEWHAKPRPKPEEEADKAEEEP